jgi:uncharacterized protein YdeI (YjbR/CyaY-like superfamily)
VPGDETPHRFPTPDAFADWLGRNDETSPGIWLVLAKKGSPMATVTYRQALLVALAHGWIDGQARRLDDGSFLQRFTPRRPKSTWSLRNRHYVEAMIADGTMSPRGLAEVARAKADGRWDRAYVGKPVR